MKHHVFKFIKDGELDFHHLHSELEKNVTEGYINKSEKGDLSLYDYSRECQFKGEWNDSTRIARGLILDTKGEKIVALPLSKFFNYGDEHHNHGVPITEPFWDGAEVYEKLDGSCGICYFYGGKWNMSTRGSFNSDQAIWGEKWLYENVDTNKLDTNFTYVFEIIYQENKIVVDYDFEGLVFLTAVDKTRLREVTQYELHEISELIGVRLPKVYEFDEIEDIVEHAKTLPKDEEGFVVRFHDGNRVKIKGDEYCRIHKILAHHSPLTVWENYRDVGDFEMKEYKKEIPEEFWDEVDEWVSYFRVNLEYISSVLRCVIKELQHLSDPELGKFLQSTENKYPRHIKSMIFPYRKSGMVDMGSGICPIFNVGQKMRKKVFDIFRPTGNLMKK